MRQRIILTVFLVTPVLLLGVILYFIKVSRPEMNAPPVGAGAGSTGGANAIGELLAHGSAKPRTRDPQPEALSNLVVPESLPQGFTLVVTDLPKLAGPPSPIYLASSLNNWNPADPAYKLELQSDSKWRITLPQVKDGRTFAFKFARGSWDLEELDDKLAPITNRTLPKIDPSKLSPGEQPKFELNVQKWGDQRPQHAGRRTDPYQPITSVGSLKRLEVQGGAGTATGQVRELLVWLPPGYDLPMNEQVHYPVLYLHDGQNLFDGAGGSPVTWRIDAAATDLITKGLMAPTIIVGVPHSGAGRNSEYLPVPALSNVDPQGERHVQWLLTEVMPRVQRAFRVKTDAASTGIGGSSLGAAVSLYAATQHPKKFGILLAESLPLRTGDAAAWSSMLGAVHAWPSRVYLGIGGHEYGAGPELDVRNAELVTAVKALDAQLAAAGLGPDRRLLVVDEPAQHNEEAWAKRLSQSLPFLFPATVDSTK